VLNINFTYTTLKMNIKKYRSHGKLLITAEYLVLLGARALAVPVKYGQDLTVWETGAGGNIFWRASSPQGTWFEAGFNSELDIEYSSSEDKANFLKKLLTSAKELNSEFIPNNKSLDIHTLTDFPVNWGLGTSSTLITNIAQWAGVDPFVLLERAMNGSGYDIACAINNKPLVYQRKPNNKPVFSNVDFNKTFINNVYFVYSGRKVNSSSEVIEFLKNNKIKDTEIEKISQLTDSILKEESLHGFIELITEHELILSKILKRETMQKKHFSKFQGGIKSLGAWGGDFLLVASSRGEEYVKSYFEQIGLSTIFIFNEMVLS